MTEKTQNNNNIDDNAYVLDSIKVKMWIPNGDSVKMGSPDFPVVGIKGNDGKILSLMRLAKDGIEFFYKKNRPYEYLVEGMKEDDISSLFDGESDDFIRQMKAGIFLVAIKSMIKYVFALDNKEHGFILARGFGWAECTVQAIPGNTMDVKIEIKGGETFVIDTRDIMNYVYITKRVAGILKRKLDIEDVLEFIEWLSTKYTDYVKK